MSFKRARSATIHEKRHFHWRPCLLGVDGCAWGVRGWVRGCGRVCGVVGAGCWCGVARVCVGLTLVWVWVLVSGGFWPGWVYRVLR